MRILIVGAGIAGPTLAFWLARAGHQPTLLEKAPALRRGGYIIDFWGAGFDIAERMGLLPAVRREGYVVQELRIVDDDGRKVGGFAADVLARVTGGRYVSLPRSELSRIVFDALDERTRTVFDDDVETIEDLGDEVRVTFARGGTESFDLVVGADGLHSRVRALTFGEEERFERYLGYQVAAVEVDGYRPRDEDVYVLHAEPGQQIGRFSMRGDRTLFLFVWAEKEPQDLPTDVAGRRARLRDRFGQGGWETPAILDAVDRCPDIYMDRVSQIRMDGWTRGRVALLGDAAHCVSLLAGQGSALAMIGAQVLAHEIAGSRGDHQVAFARYEERLRPFILGKQRAAERFASSFAPRSSLGLTLRNWATRLLGLPLVAELGLGRGLRDAIDLPADP